MIFFKKTIEAPFGLKWGQSSISLREKGVKMYSPADQDEYGYKILYCEARNPPKPVSFCSVYRLRFLPGFLYDRLGKVSANGFEDITGTKGKGLYAQIKSNLIRKYGEPTQAQKKKPSDERRSEWGGAAFRGNIVLEIEDEMVLLEYQSEEWAQIDWQAIRDRDLADQVIDDKYNL